MLGGVGSDCTCSHQECSCLLWQRTARPLTAASAEPPPLLSCYHVALLAMCDVILTCC